MKTLNPKTTKHISKLMSLVLRHDPAYLGLSLSTEGWVDTYKLLSALRQKFPEITLETIEYVVATNDKKRFTFNNDGSKIRASQGHSIDVDLNLSPVTPPEHLYHGTVAKFLESIREEGLQKMSRQHLHLSADQSTAVAVGTRRGTAIILTIEALKMHEDGFAFYLSENGVWLTNHVPAKYIQK